MNFPQSKVLNASLHLQNGKAETLLGFFLFQNSHMIFQCQSKLTEDFMSEQRRANIRNSTAEFLVFTGQAKENSIEVRVAEESVWLTQKLMGTLFEVSVPTINEHLSNLFTQNEIYKEATIRNFRIVQKEGSREVARNVEFYNLDAIIAVGFRVNSTRAIQFRQWAIGVLRDFAIRGYVLDKERLKNGSFFTVNVLEFKRFILHGFI